MSKWISCEGGVAFTQNIPQGSEVYRPASGFMKPCRNGVINKKEAVRMLFLEYLQCSACQKAKKWLDEHQIPYEDRHIVENNPTFEELKDWYERSGLPLKKFFNTSGMLYKEMKLKDKLPEMSEEEQLKLLATNGMLVKRPLIVDGDRVLTGFKMAEWEALL